MIWKNKKGNVGRGQLTSVGEQQMFDLGRVVRKKYLEELKFLSPEYDPNEILYVFFSFLFP